jgi:hypothetical protein
MKKIIGILIVGVLIATVFPCVDASIHITDEKENIMIYESRLFGFGFVFINGFTNTIKGFVLFGINDGQFISMEFINIKYNEADNVLAGYLPPLMFYIRYNPVL